MSLFCCVRVYMDALVIYWSFSLSISLFVYLSMYLSSLTYTHAHIYIYIYIHIYAHMYTHIYTRMHAYVHTYTYIHVYTHKCINSCTHIYIHTQNGDLSVHLSTSTLIHTYRGSWPRVLASRAPFSRVRVNLCGYDCMDRYTDIKTYTDKHRQIDRYIDR